jgi:uncharacterized protein YdaU (DUF1376 family)
MAKSDAWMPLYIADYEQATSRLSLAEDGAYLRLIRDYWVNGAPPDDDATLARILRIDRREWMKLRPVLIRFFRVRGGVWTHDRVERERARAQEITDKRRQAGLQGGRPKHQASKPEANGFANGSEKPKQNETPARVASPSPTPDGVLEDASASSVGSAGPMPTSEGSKDSPWERDADFMAAWKACTELMRTRSSRKASWSAWRRSQASSADKRAAHAAYLAKDADVRRTGGPGFHLWIRDKLDEWLAQPSVSQQPVAALWSGPAEVREAVEKGFGDPARAASFLQSCRWDGEARTITSENSFVVDTIRQDCGPRLARLSVKVLQSKERAA